MEEALEEVEALEEDKILKILLKEEEAVGDETLETTLEEVEAMEEMISEAEEAEEEASKIEEAEEGASKTVEAEAVASKIEVEEVEAEEASKTVEEEAVEASKTEADSIEGEVDSMEDFVISIKEAEAEVEAEDEGSQIGTKMKGDIEEVEETEGEEGHMETETISMEDNVETMSKTTISTEIISHKDSYHQIILPLPLLQFLNKTSWQVSQ